MDQVKNKILTVSRQIKPTRYLNTQEITYPFTLAEGVTAASAVTAFT